MPKRNMNWKPTRRNCVKSQSESNCEGSGINIMNKLVKDIYTRFGVILRSKYMCGSRSNVVFLVYPSMFWRNVLICLMKEWNFTQNNLFTEYLYRTGAISWKFPRKWTLLRSTEAWRNHRIAGVFFQPWFFCERLTFNVQWQLLSFGK